MRRLLLSFGLLVALSASFASLDAQASIYTFTGSGANLGNSATADFTFNAALDTLTVVLTNTTSSTLDAGDLFTGIRFGLGGLVATLSTDLGVQRSVAGNGSYTDTPGAVNLSWSSNALGGGLYQLDFNPDAKDALIGPPTAGSYAAANGSITGNPGHNPFAAQTATFVFSVPGLLDTTPLTVTAFLFGTGPTVATGTITVPTPDPDPDGEPSVPEPASLAVFSVLALIGGAGYYRRKQL
jgi:hypothetical protein